MRRMSVLAVAIAVVIAGCSSHSGAVPGPAIVSPQVFQKQPFKNPWLLTHLGVIGAAPSALVAQGKYVWVADSGAAFLSRVSMRQGSKNFNLNSPLALHSDLIRTRVATGREIPARVTPAGATELLSPRTITDRIISGPDGALWYKFGIRRSVGIK